ncbi:hypothetical protein RCH14_004035 [Massilia sp. MP_M2]|uniref:hypothetical protein n=1 Tax=Massilia sp. MP_M2 TaxID=3071713 RepID=UPI00319DF40C
MNTLTWIGMIIWGMVLTLFGLLSAGPAPAMQGLVQAHDVLFMVAGGLLTCVIGFAGLFGMMGWIPGIQKQKSCV